MAVKTLYALIALCVVFRVHASIQSPPRIIKQPPVDEILFPGKWTSNYKIVIECEAEGEPTPSYRWMKNGKEFHLQKNDDRITQRSGGGTIVIAKAQNEDAGEYQCFAENEHGIATSNSVYAIQVQLNDFKEEAPKTVEANEGDPLTLKCDSPYGTPKPKVYWLIQYTHGSIKTINSTRISLDPEGNLHFSNVTRNDASDDFYYTCIASAYYPNGGYYLQGNRVYLNVIPLDTSPTQIRYPPTMQYVSRQNEVALRGKKVELFCIYGGTPLPQIEWSKNGQSIHWDHRFIAGNFGKSLIIRNVAFKDAGAYKCKASNGVGNMQSSVINVDVHSAPYFTVEPEIQNANENETVEFRCEASGVPTPEIKWIHNGKPIADAEPNPRRIIKTNSIVINDLKKSDTGNYGCNATNALGYVYKDVYLNVLSARPDFIEPPGRIVTVQNRRIVFRCRVFGVPTPQIKWTRNGSELIGDRFRVKSNGYLVIRYADFDDAGEYTCHAINKFGESKASGSLIVKDAIRFVDKPEDFEVTVGDSVTFDCNAVVTYSPVDVEWLRNSKEIDFNNEIRFIHSKNNSLTIMKTVELDSGTYTCVASTEFDEVLASATLIVQDIPNAPRFTRVRCGERDAFILWESQGDNRAPILHYTIEYSTSSTPNNWTVIEDKFPATDFKIYGPIVSPWMNYTFRVIAVNKVGPSLPSKPSEACSTPAVVSYKNPNDVRGAQNQIKKDYFGN